MAAPRALEYLGPARESEKLEPIEYLGPVPTKPSLIQRSIEKLQSFLPEGRVGEVTGPEVDVFRTGLEYPPAESPPAVPKKTMLTDIRPEEKPPLLQRIATGPVGDVAAQLLEGMAKPVKAVSEYIAKPLAPFPELLKPETYTAEGTPEEKGRRVMGAIAQPFPEVLSKPIEAGFEATRKVSPAGANVLEGAMLYGMTGAAGPHGARPRVGLIASRAFERVKGRLPTSRAEVTQAIREEPAFVEALKEERAKPRPEGPPLRPAPVEWVGWQETPGLEPEPLWNLTRRVGKYPKGSTVGPDTLGRLGFEMPEPPTARPIRETAETLPPKAPEAPGTTIREPISDIQPLPEVLPAGKGQTGASGIEVPRAETQPPEVKAPAVQAATAETYQEPKPIILWQAERRVGDVKEGRKLGEFLTNDPSVAWGLAAGEGKISQVSIAPKRLLRIEPNARLGADKRPVFDDFTGVEINRQLKAAGVKFRFDETEYEAGESLWRMIDEGGSKFRAALRKVGYDAIEYPEFLQGKEQATTLVFDPSIIQKIQESPTTPERLSAQQIIERIKSQQAPEHFDKPKITKQVEKGGETYVKTEVDPNALNVPRETSVEPGISAPEKGPIVVDDKGKVIDGRHRVVDAKEAGEGIIEAYVPEGSELATEGWSTTRPTDTRKSQPFAGIFGPTGTKPQPGQISAIPTERGWVASYQDAKSVTHYSDTAYPKFDDAFKASAELAAQTKGPLRDIHQNPLEPGTPEYDKRLREHGVTRVPEKAVGELQAAKQPWGMTSNEYVASKGVPTGEKEVFARTVQTRKALAEHEATIKQALSEGKLVPPEVLAEYPDLAKGGIEPSVTPKRGPGIEEPTQIKPLEPEGRITSRKFERPIWADEFESVGGKINPDGTVDLYHATTKEKAETILKMGRLHRPKDAPDSYGVYFSSSPEIAESYGDGTVVRVRVRVEDLKPDDVVPGKRLDFSAETKKGIYKPVSVSRPSPSTPPIAGGEVPPDISLTKTAGPKHVPPKLGETGDDVYRGWRKASSNLYPREVVVGIIPGEGVYSWRGDKIVRQFTERARQGNVATYRDATPTEIQSIHDAIDAGTFQVERQRITGALGVRKFEDAGQTVKVLHQATGTPPKIVELPAEPLSERGRSALEKITGATVEQPISSQAVNAKIRAIMELDKAKIDAYDPQRAVSRSGRQWTYNTVEAKFGGGRYDTRRDAVDAAKRHKELKLDQYENPSDYYDLTALLADKRLKLIEKYMSEGMGEMDAAARARAEIPEVKSIAEPRNVAAQKTIGPTERRAQLEQAIADGEARLRTRKNAIGERLSGKEIAATRKAVAEAKKGLAEVEKPIPSKAPLAPEEQAAAEEMREILGGRRAREVVKVVRPPKTRIATTDQSLATFLENDGGISIQKSGRDAGELRPMRESPKGKRFIHAKAGRSVNDVAERAWEAGFIDEPTSEALYKGIDSEIEGRPVVSFKGSRRERLMDLEAERELERGFETEEAELRKPRTPFDTPDIIEARFNQGVSPQTIEINTPEREAFRERLADQFYGEGAANKARRADIIIGPSGAGKSTIFVKPLAEQHGSLTIDPDFVKPAIPEYAGGRQAGIVHKESASIVEDRILLRAVVNGDNIVYPVTGKNATRIEQLVSELKKAGYSIHLHLLDLPAEKAAQRVVDRFKETNRFIDPEGVLKVGLNPRKTFDTLKKEADSYEAYTADVPFGERPRLLERGPEAEEVAGRRLRGRSGPEGPEAGQPHAIEPQAEVSLAFEPTEAGMQGLIPGTEGREIPRAPLRPKVQQAEGPLELERPGIEKQQPGLFAEPKAAPDLSTASLTDLVKKGFGEETDTVGKLTPEQQAAATEARAARKEIYRRLSVETAKTGETLEAVAERMKLPPGTLQRLQAEQEPFPSRGFVTSIKNAQVDKEMAEMGLPPPTHGERVSFEDSRATAERMVQADPFAGKKLVDDLSRQPRPVTATEDALLLTEQTRLKNERIQAEDALIEAQKSGDQTAIGEARARVDAARADFMTIGDVVTKVGTESSLSLGHRRMMMKEDYALAAMERTKQISKGRPLTEAELAEVKTLHEKITATQKAFDDYVAKAELRQAEIESELTHARVLAEAKEAPTIDPAIQSLVERVVASMETQADAARVRLHEKLGRLHAGLDPTIVADMSIIGAAKIARVGLDFGRWSQAMVEDLGEKIRPYLQAAWEASNKRLESHIGRMAGGKKEPVERVIKGTDLAEQREAARGQLRAKVESGEDISPQAQTLARLFVEQGIKERGALIDAVYGELKEVMPDITRRQVMDAISGYGRYRQLSKDEISVELRDLKGQMQQVAKLEDIQSREPPLKTGVERRIPTDEERRLIQQVNEAKRRFGVVVTDPATQLQSALGARKTYYRNQISDLEAQIAAKEKFVKEKTAPPTDAEIESLKVRRDELKQEFDAIFGTPGLTDAQRVAMAVRGLAKSITDLEQRIKTGDIGPRTRVSKAPSTPELEAMRARRDALREELQELRDAATPKKTPEQIALQSLKTRLANQTADMLDRLARGDFTKKPKRTIQMDPEAQRLAFENVKIRQQYHEGLMKDRLAHRTMPQKIVGGIGEVINTSRAILTGLDLSAVLRQGGFTTFGHPIRAAKVFPAMLRALLSEKGQHAVNQEILSRQNYPLYKRSKLYLAEHGQTLSQMEEAYMSRWAERIPLVAASQRAYTTFLNRLRADSFDAMVHSLGRSREVTAEEASAIANFVNVSTGRGTLGMRENAAVGLNTVFFAPRYVASRFQLIVGQPFYRGTTRTRGLIAQEYARYLIGLGMVYGLAEMSGADIETDSRSSDFGKIKIGNTRIDPLSGLSQATVLLSRLATGETKTLRRDRVVPIRGEKVPYGGANAADVLAWFLRSKLSPAVGTTVNVLAGKDFMGDPVTPESVATNLVVPLAMQDIYDAMIEQGAPRGAALGLLATFGMGLQTFDERKRKRPERRTFGQRLEHFGERLGLGTAP